MTRLRACALSDVAVGEALRVTLDDHQIAVVNLGAAGVRAIDAVCSHEPAELDAGVAKRDLVGGGVRRDDRQRRHPDRGVR